MNKGNTCIVIGNGPSLRGFDFHRLTGFSTLGMNAAYRHWDRIGWYPSYYACLDDQVIKTHHLEIERLYSDRLVKKLFLHRDFFGFHPHRIGNKDFTVFDQTHCDCYKKYALRHAFEPLFDNPAFVLSNKSKITTGAHSVRYVANLGYETILLLGIDLRYVEVIPEAVHTEGVGLRIEQTPKSNPNYFFDGYQKAGDLYNIPNPSVHNGALHQQSFELIPKDFINNNVRCTIYNGNKNSVLSDKNIFPFMPVEKLLGESALGSVFIPCNEREVHDIISNFSLWNTLECIPCYGNQVSRKPSLVLIFNNAGAKKFQNMIKTAFMSQGMNRFFSRIAFEYLNLQGEADQYIRDYTQQVGDSGYKSGPNNQFFSSIRLMEKYGRYSFLMEVDCVPIRRGWLSKLQELVAGSDPFWIMGSAYRGVVKLSTDFVRHMNGNSVYATGDPEFQEFVTNFWEHHTWRLVRDKDKRLAYDCILEIMFSESSIRDPDVMDTWKHSAHRFRYFEFLQNISGKEDIAGSDESLISDLRLNSPDTYILHNSTVHKIMLSHLAEGKFEQSLHDRYDHGVPRVLLIDITPIGNGSATGEIKANMMADWPDASFLQIAQHGIESLAAIRREGEHFVVNDFPAHEAANAARQAIDAFLPDVVLYRPVPDNEMLHHFAMGEIARLNKPLVTWIMDDWPARMETEMPEALCWMAPDLSALLARSTTCLSISDVMSEAFARRYGRPFRPLANGIDPADWLPIYKHKREDFVLRYAGGLAHDMNRDSVIRVASAVESLAQAGMKIRFEISTQRWWLNQCNTLFARFSATSLQLADKTIPEYRHWLAEADALLIAYNFDDKSLLYVRYSLANKMPDCLASGAAILAHGPQEAATVAYLAGAEIAKVADTPNEGLLVKAISDLVQDNEARAKLGDVGRRHAFSEFNIHLRRNAFRDILAHAADACAVASHPSHVTGESTTEQQSHPTLSSVISPFGPLKFTATLGTEEAQLMLQSCVTMLLLDPAAGLQMLAEDKNLICQLTDALADLPADSMLRTHFHKVLSRAEAETGKSLGLARTAEVIM